MVGWFVLMALEISGANTADECEFPTVVSFEAGDTRCTGTLVHPSLVVTAAHCIEAPPSRVRFGEAFMPFEFALDVESCTVSPDWAATGSPADDFGFCVLAEPFDALPITPLLASCEVEVLTEGTFAAIVGFGLPSGDGVFGRKRYAFTTLSSDLSDAGTLEIGDAEVNGCPGDSGGPAIVQLADGTWRVVGVLAQAPGCGEGPARYRTLADQTDWIKVESGIDATLCFDDDGAWSGCGEIDADPKAADATWDGVCEGEFVVPEQTCEPAPPEGGSSSTGADAASSTGDLSTSSSSSSGAASTGTTGAEPEASGDASGCQCSSRTRVPGIAWLVLVFMFRRGRCSTGARLRRLPFRGQRDPAPRPHRG